MATRGVKKKKPSKAASRRGRRSRDKGKKWERVFARSMRRIFGETVHRGDQRRRGGAGVEEGADVDGHPFWAECKHEKTTVNIWGALRQSMAKQAEKGDTRPPLVVAKTDKKPPGWKPTMPGQPPLVSMRLDDWLDLVAEWWWLKQRFGQYIGEPGAPEPAEIDPRGAQPGDWQAIAHTEDELDG